MPMGSCLDMYLAKTKAMKALHITTFGDRQQGIYYQRNFDNIPRILNRLSKECLFSSNKFIITHATMDQFLFPSH